MKEIKYYRAVVTSKKVGPLTDFNFFYITLGEIQTIYDDLNEITTENNYGEAFELSEEEFIKQMEEKYYIAYVVVPELDIDTRIYPEIP